MRLGLFGGTFDPPHIGHLIVAQDARIELSLDRVIFVPAATPPHKRHRVVAPADLRLAMVRAAIEADDRLIVDDIEIRRGGASYTVDTLRAYRTDRPDAELFLIIGADQYAEFDTWREAGEIRRLARLAVLARDGGTRGSLANGAIAVSVTRIDVSATEIRRRVRNREPIRYLVPLPVEAIIRGHRLYETAAG
ncbi:MAG: nicotinate-nucleotide adenylyltransferase [Longimicrobiales bacterium]